jgi:hypothetical protein
MKRQYYTMNLSQAYGKVVQILLFKYL